MCTHVLASFLLPLQESLSRVHRGPYTSTQAALALARACMDTGVHFWRQVLSWEPIKYIKVASTSMVGKLCTVH